VKRRRLLMGILVTTLALILGYGTAYVASEDVAYLTRRHRADRHPREAPAYRAAGRRFLAPRRHPRVSEPVLAVREHAAKLWPRGGEDLHRLLRHRRDTLLLVLVRVPQGLHLSALVEIPHRRSDPLQGLLRRKDGAARSRQDDRQGFASHSGRPRVLDAGLVSGSACSRTAMVKDSVELASLVFHESPITRST
jgi:hypothetical protein